MGPVVFPLSVQWRRLSGALWWIFGASAPVEWGGCPGSALIPLTVSDLEALPPPNINEKAVAAKKEREARQKAKMAEQRVASTTKYAKKMDKRSGDKYNKFKAKADAKKAAAAVAKAEAKEEKKKASGERNTGAGFSRALHASCASLASLGAWICVW